MTPSSPYITPYPGLSTVSASIVERFRRCGATPQIQFPIGHLYSDERALDFEEAKLREAATLAWKMLCNEFSLKILSSALGPRLLDDDGNAHIDSEIEERVKRWLSGNDCSIVIQRALDEGIWGYCSRDSYMELNISEQLLGYLTREETSSSLRATAVFALTIANAAVSSMRMSLAVQTDQTVIIPFDAPPRNQCQLAPSPRCCSDERPASPVQANNQSSASTGVEGQGEWEWHWEEQFTRGSLGRRRMTALIYASALPRAGETAWFELSDDRLKDLIEGKIDMSLRWSPRYTGEKWNRTALPAGIIFRNVPGRASPADTQRDEDAQATPMPPVNFGSRKCATAAMKAGIYRP